MAGLFGFGSAMVDFYHYTSETYADMIINSGVIRESMDGGADAMLGRGVYGTALPPSAGKPAIAYNNWTQGWKRRERRGRVDVVFKIKMPKSRVQEFRVPSRHIYLHKGEIRLNDYDWQLLVL